MNIKNLVVTSVLAIAVALGVTHFSPKTVVTQKTGGTTPEISSPYFVVNGLAHWYSRIPLTAPTSTPCAILSPAATTTLVHAALQVQTASSTATTWVVAKSASGFATTTQLGQFSLSSGVMGTMVASSTQYAGVTVGVDPINVIAPSQYIVWSYSGSAVGDSTKFNGSCTAEFIQI